MAFEKLVYGSEAAAGTKTTPIEECTVESVNGSLKTAIASFSSERDIDLYEPEELCDAVGWSRRRRSEKALEHSFLVASLGMHTAG